MNEELKIIIKAIADDAQRELEEVREELRKIKEEGDKADKGLKESFGKIAKGAAIVVGAITAVVGTMVALTKSSMEFQKAQSKLITSFQAVGSSAGQANETYKDLYRFLGDVNTATEAAQSLALITTNQKELAEWTTILQGAYSLMGDKLPTEGLAEAANETIKTGVVTGNLADALNWLGVSEDAVNEKLATLNTQAEREAFLRSTLNSLYSGSAAIYERNNQAMLNYNESQAKLDQALANATRYVLPLMTQLNNLGATLLQVLGPAFETVSAIIIVFVEWIITAIQYIGAFFGLFSKEGSSAGEAISATTTGIQIGLQGAATGAAGLGSALGDAAEQAKELKKQTMGFDELNVVSSQTSASSSGGSSGGGGGGGLGGGSIGGLDIPNLGEAAGLEDFKQKVAEIKEKMEGVLVLAGLVALALLGWKIADFIDNIKNTPGFLDKVLGKAKSIGGWMLIIGGALLLIQGYSDAWANGIDWGNLATILGGIALTVGGLALAFGPTAAIIGVIVGGIALLVLGIKDVIENGYSMEAVLAILAGAIMVVVGVILLFNAALLANPITWIIIAIMALVAVFVILWNECEGFRQFWIDLWNGIKKAFKAVWEWLKQAAKDIAQFFVDAWNAIKNAFSAVGSFFSGVWSSIKNAFSAVGKWFSDIFSSAWNGIKKAFSAVGSFFSGIWSTIKGIFSKVGSTIGNAVSGAFKSAINWVLDKAIGIINGFLKAINFAIGIINKIPGVEIKKLALLEVPKMATGGIVTSATTALIGEAGREAVLPLENNTGWMDTLADRIAARNNTPSTIVLTLDGKALGQATIGAINNITRQTGKLQLTLA